MMKYFAIFTIGLLLCGCVPQYQNRPWGDCIYASGKAYVMQGTETLKTATLLTADGTFKKFTFPIERQFDLFEAGEPQTNLGHFVHKARDCAHSCYQYFPQIANMLSLDDYEERIQNLTLQKSFRVDGTFLSLCQAESRFCLLKDYDANRLFEVDKLTGSSVKLTRASADFVGDTWHVNLFVANNGRIITRTETDYAKKTITVSAWDVQNEVLRVKPFSVSYTNDFREPKVVLCEADDEFILLVVSDGNDFSAKSREISVKTFTPDGLTMRQSFLLKLDGTNFVAGTDNQHTLAILFNESENVFHVQYRWGLRNYDLATGNCIRAENIEAPADGLNRSP
jgi:hypothetical protein